MTSASLKEKPVRDLARMAKQHGVAGWHAMRKDQLIKALVSKAKKALPIDARRSAARPAKPSGERSKAALVQPSPAAVAHNAEVARRIAEARGKPAWTILDDKALRAIARERPDSLAALLRCKGIGEKRLADFGDELLNLVSGKEDP